MRAIILAAGAGTRLRDLTRGRPKCLVSFGSQALLDHQLEALRAAGIEDVVVVVGFEADQVRRHCGHRARCLENGDWAGTNSIFSLYCARAELAGDVVLCNCDILFHGGIATRLCAAPGSAIAVDSRAPRLAGEMNVRVGEGQRVVALGKDLDLAVTTAVSAQLARFDAAGTAMVRQELERLVRDQTRDAFPTAAYGPLIAAGRLRAVEVCDLPWAEVDSPEDYERAARDVAPRLKGSAPGATG